MEVPTTGGEQQTVKTTEQSVSQTVTPVTGGSQLQTDLPSTSQQQPHVIFQWLQNVEAQPSSIDDMLVDQISGLANISQHLFSSNMSNADYQAILLSFNEDVEQQNEKIVDEAEEDGNVDAWLSKDFVLEMDEVLAKFRNDYVTILGSNARALTPQEVYNAVTDVHKA